MNECLSADDGRRCHLLFLVNIFTVTEKVVHLNLAMSCIAWDAGTLGVGGFKIAFTNQE